MFQCANFCNRSCHRVKFRRKSRYRIGDNAFDVECSLGAFSPRADNLRCFLADRNTLVQSSQRNPVYVGNFDSDGLNVNDNSREKSNSNLGVCPAR